MLTRIQASGSTEAHECAVRAPVRKSSTRRRVELGPTVDTRHRATISPTVRALSVVPRPAVFAPLRCPDLPEIERRPTVRADAWCSL